MSEKMIIALFLVKERNGKESTIPVGFSVDSILIPGDLKPFEIHFDNYVKIEVRGYQPVTAMIVVVGEDSKDLLAGYKTFVSKAKTHKPPNLQTKVSHWMPLSNLVDLKKSREFAVKPISKAEFNSFIKHVENLQKPVNISCTPEIVNLDDNSNPASTSTKSSNLDESDENKALKDLICSTREKIKKLRGVTEVLVLTQEQKDYFNEIASIQDNLVNIFLHIKPMKNTGHSTAIPKKESNSSMMDLRIIPELDATKEQSKGITFVEGLLPVKTVKYKKFCKSLPKNINDREPNAVITNFVKFCFPNHWLTGVTVAGKGNNKSLLSIWNHNSPLNDPVSGSYDESLGKARFEALIDHTMRKCGRKSYDSYTVGFLNNQVGKTMYYQRTRISVKKSQGSSRSTKDTTTESEDIEEDDPEYGQVYDDDEGEDDDDEEDSEEYEESDTTLDWEESQDKSSKAESSKVKPYDSAAELSEDKRFDWGGGFSQKISGSKIGKQAQRSEKSPVKEKEQSPEKEKEEISDKGQVKSSEKEKFVSKDFLGNQSGQHEAVIPKQIVQKAGGRDLVGVGNPQKSAGSEQADIDGGGLPQNADERSEKEYSPPKGNTKTIVQKDNGEDLFDDDEDEFLGSMYNMEHEISGHEPLFGDEISDDGNPITSTPAKIKPAIPAVGVIPAQPKLNISLTSNKSESDLNEIKKSRITTSDSGISLSDASIIIQQQQDNQPHKANKEAGIISEDTSDKIKDIDQGTKRKYSDATGIGSNKMQKNEEKNTEIERVPDNKPETTVKASTSSASSVQVSASIAPEILALLSNPDNQLFLSTILAQMTKKN